MSAQDMHEAPRCRHLFLSGRRCKAPARRGSNWCLFHAAEHDDGRRFTFQPVEDAAAIQIATNNVLEKLCRRAIDLEYAQAIFAGLRIARNNLRDLNRDLAEPKEQEVVTEYDERGLGADASLWEHLMADIERYEHEHRLRYERQIPWHDRISATAPHEERWAHYRRRLEWLIQDEYMSNRGEEGFEAWIERERGLLRTGNQSEVPSAKCEEVGGRS